MQRFAFLILCYTISFGYGQQLTGEKLLQNAINFHDPNKNWDSFDSRFKVIMETPNSSDRLSVIHLDFLQKQFDLTVTKDDITYRYKLDKDTCELFLNGSKDFSDSERDKYRLTCKRANMMKDYYTYLYGLPMKLKDPGTNLSSKVEKRPFKGTEYLVLKVTYDEDVGDDIWYFYFEPNSFEMKAYQFFHDEAKNDGEFILLEGLEIINGINMPKKRSWYYNTDEKFLGIDILEKSNK